MCSKKKRDGRGRLRELETARVMVGMSVRDFVILAFRRAYDADPNPQKKAFDLEAVQGTANQYQRKVDGRDTLTFDQEVLTFMEQVKKGLFKSQRKMFKVPRPKQEEPQPMTQ